MEPGNAQLKDALSKVEQKVSSSGGRADGAGSRGFANPFADPNLLARIASNPKLAQYLKQPDFMRMLQEIMQDPNSKTAIVYARSASHADHGLFVGLKPGNGR